MYFLLKMSWCVGMLAKDPELADDGHDNDAESRRQEVQQAHFEG